MSEEPTRFAPEDEPASAEVRVAPRRPPAQGEVVAEKYRIEHTLGRGGMGQVVAATHLQLGQLVALKFMLPAAMTSATARTRFEREARAAARLKSPHVAKVLDTGALEGGAPYIVMEYLAGETLAERLKARRGDLPIEEVVDFVLQACEGLAEAHSLGIVHRDLKPANLFVAKEADGSPCVKVLDFGISKVSIAASSDSAPEGAETQGVVGSPLYMSPEQLRSSREVDARSDVWALGVCLYELLTGKMPFAADTVHQQYAMVMHDPVPRASATRRDLPAGLDLAIARCLERNPADRFQDVAELARALEPFAPLHAHASVAKTARMLGEPRASRSTPAPPAVAPASTSSLSMSRSGEMFHASPRPSVPWLVIGVAAAALALAGGAALYSSHGASVPRQDAMAASAQPGTSSVATLRGPDIAPQSSERPPETLPVVPPSQSAVPRRVSASPAPLPRAAPSARKPVVTAPSSAPPDSDTIDLSHRK